MGICKVVRIESKPHAQYGGFYELNESDFNPKIHALFSDKEGEKEGEKKAGIADLREALTAKGIPIQEGAKKAELQALLSASE